MLVLQGGVQHYTTISHESLLSNTDFTTLGKPNYTEVMIQYFLDPCPYGGVPFSLIFEHVEVALKLLLGVTYFYLQFPQCCNEKLFQVILRSFIIQFNCPNYTVVITYVYPDCYQL